MTMTRKKLHNNIMRRVYYAYVFRTVSHPVLLHGVFMLGLLIALTHFVSLGNVIHNILEVQVGKVGGYLLGALLNTEAWTLIILGLLIFSGLSLRFSMRALHPQKKLA